MTRFPPTPSNLKLSPQVEERKGCPPHSSLGTPSPSIPQPPRSTNKEGFVQRMNEDSFLLGILLKLESRGLLPSMTPVGSPQPNLQMPLISNGHLAVAEYSASLRCGSRRIFESNRATRDSLGNAWKHNTRPFFTVGELNRSPRDQRFICLKVDNTKVIYGTHNSLQKRWPVFLDHCMNSSDNG